jgi:tetratricopeptide (TPR) repeat protein
VLAVVPARADTLADARAHYERGSALFDVGKFADAAHEYEAAYELRPDPVLLFNIGQAYRLASDYAKAIFSYKAYLRRVPNAQNRGMVEARIAEMTRLLEAQPRSQPGLPAPPAEAEASAAGSTDAPARARTKRWVGIGVGAAGVALIAVGAGLTGVGISDADALNDPQPRTTWDPAAEERMRTEQTAGIALLVTGGVALAAGAIVAGLSWRDAGRRERVAVGPAIGGDRVGAAVRVTF